MTTKTPISHITSCGIVYRREDPSQVFLEIKDDGFPSKAFRRQLCLIGGNWIGEAARNDRGPLDTLRRELDEELLLDRAAASTIELVALGYSVAEPLYLTPRKDVVPTSDERERLRVLKAVIAASYTPFGSFLQDVPRSLIERADAADSRPGFRYLSVYWLAGLFEEAWATLVHLQERFGNLSQESISVLTSLGEINAAKTHTAFGHDRVLRDFFRAFGFAEASALPIVEEVTTEWAGHALASYAEYLERYEIARRPA